MNGPKNRFDSDFGEGAARREFVDRTHYLNSFLEAMNGLEACDEVAALNVYGIPGVGKTRLSKEMYRLAQSAPKSDNVSACHVDFEVPVLRLHEEALFFIRQRLKYRCNTFDFAFARYWTLLGRSMSALESKKAIRSGSLLIDIADYGRVAGASLAEQGGLIPGLGLLVKLGGAAGRKIRNWLSKHQQLLEAIDKQTLFELRERLAYYLGVDVREAAENGARSVFIFDSLESLGGGKSEQWLRDLLATSRRSAAVLFSRQKLNWGELASEDWGDAFVPVLLDRLDDHDVDEFLKRVPIPSKELRDRIVEISHGSPFLVDLCVDSWESAVAAGREPTPADIAIDSDQIVARFMGACTPQEQATLRALSIPDVFDRDLFVSLVTGLGTGYPADFFERLVGFSFVRQLDGADLFHLHSSFRGAVLGELSEQERGRCQNALMDYCESTQLNTSNDNYLVAMTIGFQLLSSIEAAAPWLYRSARDLIGAGYAPEVSRLVSDFQGRLDVHGEKVVALVRSLTLRRLGDINGALNAHEEGDPELIYPYSSFALFNYTNLRRITGQYSEAGELYAAIAADRAADPKTRTLATKQLADLLMLRGRFNRALQTLEAIDQGDLSGQDLAELHRQFGHVYRWNFEESKAKKSYEAAQAIAEKYALKSMLARIKTNLLELSVFCCLDPSSLVDDALIANEDLGAEIEIGKVRCARAIYFARNCGDQVRARSELVLGYLTFRKCSYRAGAVFARMASALISYAGGDASRAQMHTAKVVHCTNELGVYGFIARGLYQVSRGVDEARPQGRVYWLHRKHALDSWQSLCSPVP